jgi:hypothetical protein
LRRKNRKSNQSNSLPPLKEPTLKWERPAAAQHMYRIEQKIKLFFDAHRRKKNGFGKI